MKVADIVSVLEGFAPTMYQEGYDNSGLTVGDASAMVRAVLLTVDVTEAVVDEAISRGADMIVSHHPLIFSGLKRLTGRTATERIVAAAIRNNIALYACHTNIDSVSGGVSFRMADRLKLIDVAVLSPREGDMVKLSVYVPTEYADAVRGAMFEAGAGHVGAYDCCSYNAVGEGSFRAGEGADPFVGEIGEVHREAEVQINTMVTRPRLNAVIASMIAAHPYEVPAYDIVPIENVNPTVGFGVVGNLPEPLSAADFLAKVKTQFGLQCFRHTAPIGRPISRVAMCGGSGSSLIKAAQAAHADAYITADLKYHDFFEAENRLIITDIGHFESEQYVIDIFCDLIREKFPNFATYKSENISNPIIYYGNS